MRIVAVPLIFAVALRLPLPVPVSRFLFPVFCFLSCSRYVCLSFFSKPCSIFRVSTMRARKPVKSCSEMTSTSRAS